MKIIVTYLLTSLILLQSLQVNIGDVLGVNDFFEHAQYHKENYGDTFFSFVSKHYGLEKQTHYQNSKNENQQHEKLPFSNATVIYTPLALFEPKTLLELKRFDNFEKQDNFYYQISFSSLSLVDIFQPPKSA